MPSPLGLISLHNLTVALCVAVFSYNELKSRLIILRGNSGSSKSTVARAIANKAEYKLALVDADMYRVEMLFPKPYITEVYAELIKRNVLYCLEHGYDVIWDSIFFANDRIKRYLGEFFNRHHPKENYIFNFYVSLEETIRRHATRAKSKVFGSELIQEWYQPIERLGYDFEHLIPETNTLEENITQITKIANI